MASEAKKQKAQASSSREFQSWWTEQYGVINKDDKAVCILCSGTVVCRTSSVKRHYETIHKNLCEKSKEEQKEFIARAIKNRTKQSTSLIKYVSSQSHISAASFAASKIIGKHGKPFSDGDYMKEAWVKCAPFLFEDFDNKEKIIQRIKDIPLARNTVKDRILKMAENVTEQQNQDIKSSNFISLCLDESTDVTSSARLAVFIRYLVGNNIKEELISLTSLATTTRGVDINEIVIKALSEKEIDLSKVVSVTTDGAPSMIGKENGFVNLFQRQVGHSLLGFHCIIHQQALCAKAGFKSLENIMSLVTKIVNLISSQALNKRKFEVLLSEIDSVYHGLLMYNNVRWLSRGKVLQRFVDCLEEIRLFLHNEGKGEQYKELMDVEWISTLMFVTDLCQHLNDLNVKLQGANKTVIIMIDMIKSFEAKLKIFYKDIISSNFKYFPNLKKIVTDLESHEEQDKAKLIQEFSTVISSLMAEFSSRFTEFKEYSDTLKFVLYPDTTEFDNLNLDVFRWLNLEEIELQITEFQSSSIWKQTFIDLRNDLEIIERDRLSDIINRNAEIQIMTTWNAIPNTFSCLKMLASAVLTIFSSTYACESLFSEMNFIKNSFRGSLPDESSSARILLKVTNYEPDVISLASKMQQQKSH